MHALSARLLNVITGILVLTVSLQAQTTFKSPKDASQGQANGIQVMDAGDINGDGRADVAVCSGGMHANSSIFAWFEAPSTISGTWTRHNFGNDGQLRDFLGSCILYDFDKDGDLDFCVSSDNHHGTTMQCDLYVYVNPGASKVTGSWSYQRVTSSTQPWNHVNDIAVDDMDKDGKPDIICRSLEPNQIHIFFQNSIGSWTKKTISTGIEQSEGLAVGDINRDGKPDIEYTGYWLKAPSTPRTSSYTKLKIDDTYKNTNQNTKEDLGDIDGDGDLDLVLAPAEHYRDGANHILAWYTNPGGTPGNTNWTKHTLVTNLNDIGQVKLRDLDDDGDLDIVYGHCFVTPYYIKAFYNNGSGSFGSAVTINSSKGLYSATIIDFDEDGDLDIAGHETYAGGTKPWVYENNKYSGTTVTKYTLSVTNGTGDGSYAAGTRVTIRADAAPTGQIFDKWTGSSAVADVYSSTTILTMPAANTAVTATYKTGTVTQEPYGGTAHAVPGRIEAEHYDEGGQNVAYYDNSTGNAGGEVRTDDVDIYATTDGGTQYKIGYNDGDEWVEYTVNAQAGVYTIRLRVSTPKSDGTCPVSVNGSPVGTATIPNTGGWDSFTNVEIKNVTLAAGEQVIRLEILGSGWDLNWFEFEKTGTAILAADLRHLPAVPAGTHTLLRLDGSTAVPDLNAWSGAIPAGMYIMVEQAGSEAIIRKLIHIQ